MNKREQVIRYLDGQMNEEEKLHFENLLTDDRELQNEINKVRTLLSVTRADAGPQTEETYFINMLPEFHSHHIKKKKFHFSKLAYSLSTAAAVVLLLFIIFKPGSTVNYSSLAELSKSFSENEIDETLNQYSSDYSLRELAGSASARTDSIVSNIFADELELTPSAENEVAAKYLYPDELLSSINETQANELYSQLINEDIIKGDKQ